MTKPAVFLGMMFFSLKVFAVSINEVKSSLNKTNLKVTHTTSQILYAGRDMLTPKELISSQAMAG